MAARRALVVDDSKTARVMLRRMLEQHHIKVDTAESAEDALDYLKYEHPHVIFMDHMMPGMDGFQAVKAIKDDPATAMIPIMMYTSKGGEVYLGEARALGAVGVLSKQLQSSELVQALRRLRLLDDNAGTSTSGVEQRGAIAAGPPDIDRPDSDYPHAASLPLEQGELKAVVKRLLEEQRGKLKNDVKESLRAAALDADARRSGSLTLRMLAGLARILLIAGLVIAGLVAYSIYRPELMRLSWFAGNVEPVRSESSVITDGQQGDGAQPRQASASDARQTGAEQDKRVLYEALEWAINRGGEYAFGELALNDARLRTFQSLVSRLSDAGFNGRLRIGVHNGRFCLTRNAFGGFDTPHATAALDTCEMISASQRGTRAEADVQSVAFANYLRTSPLFNDGGIDVQIVSHGHKKPLFAYPSRASLSNAGAWNRIAGRNNRVEITLIPNPRQQ